ncbi:MAG: EamA family transporter [Candidatus Diapherotrites archaeon]|nr:EamA family transporter [Candidatus Diapherotrites archaeon]
MLGWFGFAVLAMSLYAIQNFLSKGAMEKKCNSATVMSIFFATAGLLAAGAMLVTGEAWANSWTVFLALAVINGSCFLMGSIARLEALKYLPLIMVYPMKKMDVAIIAVVGLLFFGEALSLAQGIGVVLAIAVIWVLAMDKKAEKPKDFRKGIVLVGIAILFFTVTDVVLKPAASEGSIYMFIVVAYGLMLLPSLLLQKRLGKDRSASLETTLKWGVAIGVVNFFAITALLTSLMDGPLSIVFPITALAVPLAGALSVVFYKEKLTVNRIVGVLLAVAVLVLMSM